MSRSTRSFVARCRIFTLTFTSTLGIAYMVFLLYLMTSAVTTTGNYDSRSQYDLRYAALKEQNVSFASLIAAPPAKNRPPSGDSPSWCLFPQRNLGPFLRSILCV
ncbi:hypothetical protein PoB_007615500 [Plakobranchus ocellatus]|uniref:Uncharacterized protein n=1 Tax=Plakobranchus ocellatus TaxID=259542 RepID=A0AAV4DZZ9_9GAST|nr:hypothetical protein PoB_007615500 [Plakobranchus ocellatus]